MGGGGAWGCTTSSRALRGQLKPGSIWRNKQLPGSSFRGQASPPPWAVAAGRVGGAGGRQEDGVVLPHRHGGREGRVGGGELIWDIIWEGGLWEKLRKNAEMAGKNAENRGNCGKIVDINSCFKTKMGKTRNGKWHKVLKILWKIWGPSSLVRQRQRPTKKTRKSAREPPSSFGSGLFSNKKSTLLSLGSMRHAGGLGGLTSGTSSQPMGTIPFRGQTNEHRGRRTGATVQKRGRLAI